MFRAFWVSIDGNSQSLVETLIAAIGTIGTRAVRIGRLGFEQEDIAARQLGNHVNVVQNMLLDTVERRVDHIFGIDIDYRTPL